MMVVALLFFLSLTFLSWKNFRLALGIFVICLPAYLIRFNIGPLPTTLLEVSFGSLFCVWLIKYSRQDLPRIKQTIINHRWFFVFFFIFFLASVGSIFVSDMWYFSFGQWRAYFLEPMLVFMMLVGRREKPHDLVGFLALSTISISIVAIVQKISGQLYPPSLWDDELNGRVTAFFTTPNAVGLYLAPILLLVAGFILPKKEKAFGKEKMMLIAIISLACLAILFSYSQGAWVALGAGIVAGAYFLGYKKTAAASVVAGIIVVLAVPQIQAAVLFKDQAGQNRLSLWRHSMTFLTASPKNFVLGAGIRQYFRKVEKPYYNPVEMERLIYPHNIFLNFWTEIGLFGLLSFVGILVYSLYLSFKIKNRDKILGSVLIASLVVFIIHGLVDVPYFKNDLSMLFWVIIATIFSSASHFSGQTSEPQK